MFRLRTERKLDGESIRLLVIKDHDVRGQAVVFDSAVCRADAETAVST